MAATLKKILKQHWLLIGLIFAATWLRTWQLSSHGILFGDAAHDLFSAVTAVENRQLPLLGIESSVPRFRQGPLSVWLNSAIYIFAGYHLLPFFIVYSLIGCAAVIAVYEFSVLYLNRTAAYCATCLIAFSPFAVAHARMPYHITPIPFATVLFLFCVVNVTNKKPLNWFLVTLSWAVLFQFELALTPLFLVIIFAWWRTQTTLNWPLLRASLLGLVLGLSPQILFDLQNNFKHLGGFAAWIIYRGVMFFAKTATEPQSRLTSLSTALWTYLSRIISADWLPLTLIGLTLIMWSIWRAYHWSKTKKLPFALELVLVSLGTLLLGFLVHSSPSEAYFPPFIVLLPLLCGWALSTLASRFNPLLIASLTAFALINTFHIWQHNFFVSTPRSFSYGPSIQEQQAILQYIINRTNGHYTLQTTAEGGHFPNYFDNFRWHGEHLGFPEKKNGTPVFIEQTDSSLIQYPDARIVRFPSRIIVLPPLQYAN